MLQGLQMISFSSKPRSTRTRQARPSREASASPQPKATRAAPAASAAGMAPLVAADPTRDDEADNAAALADADADAVAVRRGWHDSSMELRRGLDVYEDLPMDTLPDDLRDSFFGTL